VIVTVILHTNELHVMSNLALLLLTDALTFVLSNRSLTGPTPKSWLCLQAEE